MTTRITQIKRIFADLKKSAGLRKIRVIRVAIIAALDAPDQPCAGGTGAGTTLRTGLILFKYWNTA